MSRRKGNKAAELIKFMFARYNKNKAHDDVVFTKKLILFQI